MKKILLSLLIICLLSFSFNFLTKASTGLSYTKISETEPLTIASGVSYKKIVAKSSKDDGTVGNQSVNAPDPSCASFSSWSLSLLQKNQW